MSRIEHAEPVTVFESGDPAVLAVAKSLLEEAGIAYYAAGEGLQNLFGMGAIGGFNPIVGPVRIEVSREDAREAREVLARLDRDAIDAAEGEDR